MHKLIKHMSDTELSDHVCPQDIRSLHLLHNDADSIRALARQAVQDLAEVLEGTDDEFDHHVPKALMVLAILDHMTDRRTCGTVCDYLNF